MSKIQACTQFINVMVKVRPGDEPNTYKVHTAPEIPYVTEKDTVINYQIYDSGDHNITFKDLTVTPPDNNQLSKPSLGLSGKVITVSDANTSKIIMNVTLHFQDGKGVEFSHDPQVVNEPER